MVSADATAQRSSRSRLVLLVDEPSPALSRAETALRRHHLLVRSAHRPTSAIALLTRERPAFTVIDPCLPGASWYRLLQAVASFRTEVIVVTGSPSKALVETAQKLGVSAYLCKPIDPDAFAEALKHGTLPAPPVAQGLDLFAGSLASCEWEVVNAALAAADGNVSVAARHLGVTRQAFYSKLRKGIFR